MRVFLFILILVGMALKSNASEGVVLLHGLCRSSGCMRKMSDAVGAAGFVVENPNYPSRTAAIERLSDAAIAKAMNSSNLKNCSKIHFVAHSLGGILIRSYFKRHKDERL